MEEFPFSQYLFWDAEIDSIDLNRNKRYIIERVLTRGKLQDFNKLLALYPKEVIRAEVKRSKILDPKTRHFCSWYFNIPLRELHVSSFYR